MNGVGHVEPGRAVVAGGSKQNGKIKIPVYRFDHGVGGFFDIFEIDGFWKNNVFDVFKSSIIFIACGAIDGLRMVDGG